MKSCKGDYVNPTNQLCAGVLRKIENVNFIYLPIVLLWTSLIAANIS
jgi:hypothetical protein